MPEKALHAELGGGGLLRSVPFHLLSGSAICSGEAQRCHRLVRMPVRRHLSLYPDRTQKSTREQEALGLP